MQKIVDVIDKANGFSLYSFVEEDPEKQTRQIMSTFAKSDMDYKDMVDGKTILISMILNNE